MREILYRAISLCRGEGWVYGQPRHYARNPHWEKWTIYDTATGIETDIDENTLGQYTGLTDKNGTKIFEGDIATLISRNPLNYGMTVNAKFLFVNGSFTAYLLDKECLLAELPIRDIPKDTEITVIGNIHDNPELVKILTQHNKQSIKSFITQ